MQWLPGDFIIFVYYVNALCILNYVNRKDKELGGARYTAQLLI